MEAKKVLQSLARSLCRYRQARVANKVHHRDARAPSRVPLLPRLAAGALESKSATLGEEADVPIASYWPCLGTLVIGRCSSMFDAFINTVSKRWAATRVSWLQGGTRRHFLPFPGANGGPTGGRQGRRKEGHRPLMLTKKGERRTKPLRPPMRPLCRLETGTPHMIRYLESCPIIAVVGRSGDAAQGVREPPQSS